MMEHKYVEGLVEKFEKPAHKSKKFLAFIFMEIWLGTLAIVALFTQRDLGWPLATFMSLIVITMGAIALTFNGYQAALDKYFRLAAVLGDSADRFASAVKSVSHGKKKRKPVEMDDENHSDDERD